MVPTALPSCTTTLPPSGIVRQEVGSSQMYAPAVQGPLSYSSEQCGNESNLCFSLNSGGDAPLFAATLPPSTPSLSLPSPPPALSPVPQQHGRQCLHWCAAGQLQCSDCSLLTVRETQLPFLPHIYRKWKRPAHASRVALKTGSYILQWIWVFSNHCCSSIICKQE